MITTEEYLRIRYSSTEQDMSSVKEYNKALLEKYPWLSPNNVWTGELSEDYDYEYTRADSIPRG